MARVTEAVTRTISRLAMATRMATCSENIREGANADAGALGNVVRVQGGPPLAQQNPSRGLEDDFHGLARALLLR